MKQNPYIYNETILHATTLNQIFASLTISS